MAADLFSVVPRPRRSIYPGRLYLVSQQGNKKHPVYLDAEDRDFASRLLHICSVRYGVRVLGFGYGEHEGRWLLQPSNRCGISCLMRDMQSTYSRYLNQKYDHRPCCAQRLMAGQEPCHHGEAIVNSSNWTARFKATEIDPEHYRDALEHLESLPSEQPCVDSAPPPGAKPAIAESDPAPTQVAISEAVRRSRPLRLIMAEFQARTRSRIAPLEVRSACRSHRWAPIRSDRSP